MGLIKVFWLRIFSVFKRSNEVCDGPSDEVYEMYTRQYDLEVSGIDLDDKLPLASMDFLKGWLESDGLEWQQAVKSALTIFDNQDNKRQKLISELKCLEKEDELKNTAVTILVDQSGSMKGEVIQHVAATVRSLTECLISVGVSVELLGYSTAGWHGGFARRDWLASGKPLRPGRLCSLLHIIYKSADETHMSQQSWQMMLNPNILRENIDGEALLWGARRLKQIASDRKILLVISDGAPVDDSTLKENGPSYLWRHLNKVISEQESRNDLELAAIGVGYKVDKLYSHSASADNFGNLFSSSAILLREILSKTA